jgi:hypothetical protein
MKSTKKCKVCRGANSGVIDGPSFSRRNFMKIAGTAMAASWFADVLDPRLLLAQTASTGLELRNTAKSCIFIFLSGAPSQVDTWDLKEGAWTPADFAPASFGSLRVPQGLLPRTSEHIGKVSFVRSAMSWAAVHQLGQVWAQISRNPTGATGAIAPHIGAVVSLESQAGRGVNDVLPGFIALESGQIPTSGYLPAKYAPFGVRTASTGLSTLSHPDGATRFDDRWALLQQLDASRTSSALGKTSMDMDDFYDQARTLMKSPGVNDLFKFTDEEHSRYGSTTFGDSLVVARNLVKARRGTRFVQATLGGWDHHSDIYDKAANASIYAETKTFDTAFGALLTDLAAAPGSVSGKSQLDETLIVVMSEFGRTVGALNNQGGRDHFLRNSVVFAGAGTKGGRAIGKTNAAGDQVEDYGWRPDRDVRPEDVACTIYSALGIDYTTVRHDDPLNRGFEYVPYAKEGLYEPIEELWS